MFFLKPPRVFALLATVFLASVLVLTGCLGRSSAFEKESLSPQGLMAEDALPADTLFALAFQDTSESQKAAFEKLKSLFPMMGEGKLEDSVFSSLKEMGLSYETDIRPVLGEKNRVVFGLTEGETSTGYLSFMINDAAALTTLQSKIAPQGAENTTYKDAAIWSSEKLTMVQYKDLAFLLNKKTETEPLIDRLRSKNNLRRSKQYQSVVKKLTTPYISYVYLDAKALMRQFEKKSGSSYSPQSLLQNSAFRDLVSAYGFVLSAQESGVEVSGYISGDIKAMKKEGVKFSDSRGSGGYFVEKIASKDLIFYNEGKNLKDAVLRMKETSPEQYARYQQMVQTWLAMDLEKDIGPIMDGPYLFSISRNEKNNFPGVTLTVDTSRTLDETKSFTTTLFERLNAGLSVLLLQFDYLKPAVTLGEVSGADKLYQLSVDFTKISEEEKAKFPAQLSSLKNSAASLTFGVQGDFFLISLYDGAPEMFDGEYLANSAVYKESAPEPSKTGEVVYVNVKEGVSYLDTVWESLQKSELLKAEEAQQFEKIREFLKPFSAVLFKIRADEYDEYVEGFVKVGQ